MSCLAPAFTASFRDNSGTRGSDVRTPLTPAAYTRVRGQPSGSALGGRQGHDSSEADHRNSSCCQHHDCSLELPHLLLRRLIACLRQLAASIDFARAGVRRPWSRPANQPWHRPGLHEPPELASSTVSPAAGSASKRSSGMGKSWRATHMPSMRRSRHSSAASHCGYRGRTTGEPSCTSSLGQSRKQSQIFSQVGDKFDCCDAWQKHVRRGFGGNKAQETCDLDRRNICLRYHEDAFFGVLGADQRVF